MEMQAPFFVLVLLLGIVTVCSGARQLLVPNGAIGGAVAATYYYGAKNINAPLIILDVNSLYFKGNHPYFYGMNGPDTDTEGKCADACARTTGCNAFVSCPTKAGCGKYCKAYVKANPRLTSPSNGLDNYVNNKLPLKAFGAWTYPSYFLDGCANVSANSATTGDKWTWGLCSLKVVPNINVLKFFPNTASSPQDGFVSGVLVKPANCPAGLPYSVCGKCNQLKAVADRARCLNCASLFKVNSAVKEAAHVGDLTYDYCPKCFAAGKNATACVKCIQDNAKTGNLYPCVM